VGGNPISITECNGCNSITVTYPFGTMTITGTNLEASTTLENNVYKIRGLGNVTVSFTGEDNSELWENGNILNGLTRTFNNLSAGDVYRIDAQLNNGNPDPQNDDYDDITFDLNFTGTYVMVQINGRSVLDDSNVEEKDGYTFNDLVINNAGTTNPSDTNTLRLQNRFGDAFVTEYTINGVRYTEDNDNVTVNDGGEWIISVPGAEKYTISATGDNEIAVPRTIIWANVDADETSENFDEDMLLEHGSAKVVGIYDENNTKVSGTTEADEDGMGWVQVNPGDKVVFEFVPEYGYQLTGVSANGVPLEAQDTMNQYEFIMPNANIHFSATFKKVDDIVSFTSDKVKNGEITLGNTLNGGSAN